ncbi:type IV toxin-antitoxin system AbiEi family antitoxin domain-containing protein [Corynebacterium suranareeae]
MRTAKELIRMKYSRRKINSLVKEGKLYRVLRGVYSMDPPSGEVVWSAIRLVRPGALLDGKSAVEVYQGVPLSLPLRVRVSTSNVLRGSANVVARRSQRITGVVHRGFRVVSLVDAIATCLEEKSSDLGDLRRLVEQRYQSGSGVNQMKHDLKALKTRRKKQLREFLEECIYGTDSGLEKKLVYELRDAGFKTRQNVMVEGYRWDIQVVGVALIDVDSRKYHQANGRNFIIDRWKSNEALVQGHVPLRFTDDCVNYAPGEIIKLVKQIAEFKRKHPRKRVKTQGVGPVFKWHNALVLP